jgi:tRNA pseudouridine32 synthase / 23S rRNA pseudouridine746 synthase
MPDGIPAPPCPPLELLHVDGHMLALNKPPGLLSVPGRGADKQNCLATRVQQVWPEAEIVHRLDQATSGLILFARGADVQRQLHAQLRERRVQKHYVALAHGHVREDAGEIDLPLIADWPQRPRQKVDPILGKPSQTRWQVLARSVCPQTGQCHTRLVLQPITGRSHQLRVHLLAIGHPLVGDALYHPGDNAPRLMLHAQSLQLNHPLDGRNLHVHCAAAF